MLTDWAHSVGVELLSFDELEKWGAEEGIRVDAGPVKGIQGEQELDQYRVASISYTSGTTGQSTFAVLCSSNSDKQVIPRESF